jgi:hypothetical protein
MKKVIIFIFCGVLIILGGLSVQYSFSRYQKIKHNTNCTAPCVKEIVPPSLWQVITGKSCDGLLCSTEGNLLKPGNGCDQSATTTPCSDIHAIQKEPPVTTQTSDPLPSFSFGPLSQTYSNKQFGFFFQYPNEITLVDRQGGCPYLMDSPSAKMALFVVLIPSCSSDAKKTSLEDYNKDYVVYGEENTKLQYRFLSNESIKTKSGIEGVYQKFSLENSEQPQISKRYVFKLPAGGFIIFLRQSDNPESIYYSSFDKAFTESFSFFP